MILIPFLLAVAPIERPFGGKVNGPFSDGFH
jgi:hypothetical protein